jgi:DNA-binding beta-propeller fold protein YncE
VTTLRTVLNFFISSILPLAILAGCASEPVKQQAATYWPKSPEKPRYVYEGSLRSSETLMEKDTAGQLRSMVTGENKTDELSFSKPYDVAARDGKIVVTDSVYRVAIMFDVPRRKVFAFGHRGDGKGKGALQKPIGVGMDGKQWTYIADVSAKDVKVFDALGMYIKSIGSQEFFQRPIDVAANEKGDRIYVLDGGGINSEWHRVIVFDDEGNKLNEIGRRGSGEGEFNLPNQLTVGRDGTLYVLDAGNFRIQAFTPEGEFIRSWGKVGRNLGNLARPRGIATDSQGNVYVTDGAFRNFQIFSNDGKLLMFIGEPGLEDKPGQFVLPAGIAVDETDRVYIVDQVHNKVDVIRKLSETEIQQIVSTQVTLNPKKPATETKSSNPASAK